MEPKVDWRALERMRRAFLEGTAGTGDYWTSESDLESYDATFAQRIGWKWDYVLNELTRRGWRPPEGALLDWGCGSGIASRAFLDHFGTQTTTVLHYTDRSNLATQFAARRARNKYPWVRVHLGFPEKSAVALVSHVLSEITPDQAQSLVDRLANSAGCIIWVEPGAFESSLSLIAIRERLRNRFSIVAPCTHQAQCGLLQPGNERHWCHQFAASPPAVYTDPFWGKFAHLAGVDLRTLPLSFIVFDSRPAPHLRSGATWIIGRPRIQKGFALLLGSNAEGVREFRLTRRKFEDEYKAARKETLDPLLQLETDKEEITSLKPLFPPFPEP